MSSRLIQNIDEESPKAVADYLDLYPMDVNFIYAHPTGVLYTPLDKAREVMANYPSRPSPMAQKILQILQSRGALGYQELLAQRQAQQAEERRRIKSIRPPPEEMAQLPMALQGLFANTPRTPIPTGYFALSLAAPHGQLRDAIRAGNLEGVRGWLGVHAELLRAEPHWWNQILTYAQDKTDLPEEGVTANTAARIVREIRGRMPRTNGGIVVAVAPDGGVRPTLRTVGRSKLSLQLTGGRRRRVTRKSRKQ
jgi:hypothetical protein